MSEDKTSKKKTPFTDQYDESIKPFSYTTDIGYIVQEKQKKDKKYITPKDSSELMRKAVIPSFGPLVIDENNQYVFDFEWTSRTTETRVVSKTNKEFLKEHNLTEKDLKFHNSNFEFSIACWLMDIRARTGQTEIEGSIKTLTKDLIVDKKPRGEDYKKVEVNLKTLAVRQYIVKHKGKDVSFVMINPFKFDNRRKEFTCYLSDSVPKVVGEITRGEKEGPKYITRTADDIYPKQDRQEFMARQYLTNLKNITQDIKQIKGETILEQMGYLPYLKHSRFNIYRNIDAERHINNFMKWAREYGLTVECHRRSLGVKNVKKRRYRIKASYKQDKVRGVSQDELDSMMFELATYFNQDTRFDDLDICKATAKGIIDKYGVDSVRQELNTGLKTEGDDFTPERFKDKLKEKKGY